MQREGARLPALRTMARSAWRGGWSLLRLRHAGEDFGLDGGAGAEERDEGVVGGIVRNARAGCCGGDVAGDGLGFGVLIVPAAASRSMTRSIVMTSGAPPALYQAACAATASVNFWYMPGLISEMRMML